ncbi:similar to Saccharomyces cerevisiae YDL173W PAR32 Putative protein of unknown function [Maudiozyma saulgeensis]|uniref:Protein PAR32 n=1 Tax=Maudiozyma saulgeensis TaxID=1789683 RepID=A0A1X7QXW3_9SACH|nr:similar to Saccharomyces cerevisiae YDL173W PAR32 Putative protein of unknown function [Kazachstania saulgeensis]
MPTQFKISTGRGGAGNIRSSNSKVSPNYIKQGSQTPNIIQPIYSTGRGGAGNMMKNYDPKLTRRAQDVDEDTISNMNDIEEQIEIRNEIENINSNQSNINHSNDDDFINPIISTTENYITNTISNVLSHISSSGEKLSQKTNDSDIIKPSKSKIRVQHKKIKKQTPIIIGRGGAGNIVSPSSSSKSGSSHSKLNITKSKHSNKSNNTTTIQSSTNNNIQKKKKKSFMSSIFGIFA